jgi:hypothetical protein
VRPVAVEVAEVASANVQFDRKNSNQSEARPLPELKPREELLSRVLQSGLYAINRGNRHWMTSNQRRQGIADGVAASMVNGGPNTRSRLFVAKRVDRIEVSRA